MKSSRQIILAVIVIAAGNLFPGQKPANAASHYGDWFGYDDSVTSAWDFTGVEGDSHQGSITPNGKAPGEATRRIFVCYPRRSSA